MFGGTHFIPSEEHRASQFEAPPYTLFWGETRYFLEAARTKMRPNKYLETPPQGDGHPVVVLPGFGTSDDTTRILRQHIERAGYNVRGWGLGTNWGPTKEVITKVPELIDKTCQETQQQVSVVGISMGGCLARWTPVWCPDEIRNLILIVSPFRMNRYDDFRVRRLKKLDKSDHYQGANYYASAREDEKPSLGDLPSTSFFTWSDGLIDPRACLHSKSSVRENVATHTTHVGASFNRVVIAGVLDRLPLTAETWKPFEPPAEMAHLYDTNIWYEDVPELPKSTVKRIRNASPPRDNEDQAS